MDNSLNLVSFDIPYPADYGGAIDIYYKIKAFKEAGIKVHLHCFQYNRLQDKHLNEICETVHYYKRLVTRANLFNLKPYIVISRTSEYLINNLLLNQYPILFEGLHCCYYLNDARLAHRTKIVRTHNIEHHYYQNLAKVERNIFRKYYFVNEAIKLKKYENILSNADGIAAISKNDSKYFSGKYKNVRLISAFHANNKVDISTGFGTYVLYHGSLEVGENNEAALYLVNKVFNDIDIPLIIAGNKPSKELIQAVKESNGKIEIKANISTEDIYKMIKEAQINILPTFQATGIKLKLLASLYTGRHCIVNSCMVKNTGLEELCIINDTPTEMKKAVINYFRLPFINEDIIRRETILNDKGFSNRINIQQLIELIFSQHSAFNSQQSAISSEK